MERIFGHISGHKIGSIFKNRQELSDSGVHKPIQAGISGAEKEGADSIVLSGAYEDDKDYGEIIIYTGQGGRDSFTGKQIKDQELTRGNLGLAVSELNGLPVRVIRALCKKYHEFYQNGYRYDGLYRVEDHWREIGKSGFIIWRFRLVKIKEESLTSVDFKNIAEGESIYKVPERKNSTILRLIRDTKQSRKIKELYDYKCQVCGIRLETSAGFYAEAAHIKPLGEPHNGSDTSDNILCLCPNHHVLFDFGAFSILDNFILIGIDGNLIIKNEHQIKHEYLQYHREHYYNTIKKD